MQNSLIGSFKIKKKYPDTLNIKIFEKKPVVILQTKKNKFYLTEKNELIKFKIYQEFKDLPYVLGNRKEFGIFYVSLKRINFPLNLIKKYTLYELNRWDLETVDGKTIKLPPKNYTRYLKNYLNMQNKKSFQKYKIFDFRINDQLILKQFMQDTYLTLYIEINDSDFIFFVTQNDEQNNLRYLQIYYTIKD